MSAPGRRPTPVTTVDAPAGEVGERLGGRRVAVPAAVLGELAEAGVAVSTDDAERVDAGRDWWPLAIAWAATGRVPALPAAIARPTSTAQVSAVMAACNRAGVPVTTSGGRSGVCGAAVPVFGGVALDITGLNGVLDVDEHSLVVDVAAGTFGPDLEAVLAATGPGYTVGHWPQSMALATVGGWLACRGAGQYSTRYGKIEDMVTGLEVVLADGRVVRTEGTGPRAATGPNLTQLFVGSEGTLGVITAARLRLHPVAPAQGRRAYGFDSFEDGLEASRRILQRGATPAVLRLYDDVESDRNFEVGDRCVLIALDEADPGLLDATLAIVDEECLCEHPAGSSRPGTSLDVELVERWLVHRNDVSALAPLWRGGVVVDTAEVAGRWAVLPRLAEEVVTALGAIPGTLVASVHESHAYSDGACLYFTFAARPPEAVDATGTSAGGGEAPSDGDPGHAGGASTADLAWSEHYYRHAWDVITEVVERHGAAISHHHGIGLNRGRFLRGALGTGFEVLQAVKRALDPAGICNPGKLGLPSPFGDAPWP